jgi:hypothetical protein
MKTVIREEDEFPMVPLVIGGYGDVSLLSAEIMC